LKLSNTARAISEIAPQASLFIPMTMPSKALPSYVMLNPRSQWHISGLFSTALESMTLPSRLKAKRETLDQLESSLNVNGNQNIAKLRMSINQQATTNGHYRAGRLEVRAESRDARLPSQDRSANNDPSLEDGELSVFDIDFFPSESADQSRGRNRRVQRPHVFGQAETYRGSGETEDLEANKEDEGAERAHRRAAGLPLIHR